MKAGRGAKGRGFFDGINKRGGFLKADRPVSILLILQKIGLAVLLFHDFLFSC
jgi:hypothetical protein